jgi:hypothetical protein
MGTCSVFVVKIDVVDQRLQRAVETRGHVHCIDGAKELGLLRSEWHCTGIQYCTGIQ